MPENFAEVPGSLPGTSAFFSGFLYRLNHEVPHPLGRFLLHFVGHVGVGVQREARAVVAQNAGHGFGIYPPAGLPA